MNKIISIIIVCTLLFCSCAPVHQNIQPRVVKQAEQIENFSTQNGVSVAAEPYIYSGQGLNYRKAGIHPLKVTLTNKGSSPVVLNTDSVLAHCSGDNLYMTYTPQEASQLVINSHAMEEAAKGAAAGAVSGAAVGALVGLALGAVFGVNTRRAAASGAIGGAMGGVGGGMHAWLTKLRAAAQAEINNNALRHSIVHPGFSKSGWLYFPGEVSLDELRIAISEEGTGNYLSFRLPIPYAPMVATQ